MASDELSAIVTHEDLPVTCSLEVTMASDDSTSLDDSTVGFQSKPDVGNQSKIRKTEKLCVVCGDRASGYHYNALSCEGCKGFFRRSIARKAEYICKFGGNCMMDMWMRRKCQACRLRRCRDVGMKEECLLSELQCTARNSQQQCKKRLKTVSTAIKSKAKNMNQPAQSLVTSSETNSAEENGSSDNALLERLTDEHRQLISLLVLNQERYELPRQEDIAQIAELEITQMFKRCELSEQIFVHMVEMTILVTRLIVEFAKHLPGFNTLLREDQVALLKGSASEVMMLRTARRYDPESGTVIFGDGNAFTRESMAFGGLQDYVNCMFDFAVKMNGLGVDNSEYALITAICIFSDRPGVSDSALVEAMQRYYVEVLLGYISHRRSKKGTFLAQLLMKLVDLRTLSFEHSTLLHRLTIERGSLPPLLQEYFDLQ